MPQAPRYLDLCHVRLFACRPQPLQKSAIPDTIGRLPQDGVIILIGKKYPKLGYTFAAYCSSKDAANRVLGNTMTYTNAHAGQMEVKGILVTTSDYGPDAYEFAKGKPLTLLSGSELLYLLSKHGYQAKIDLREAKKLLS
jgi:hypothetical protein